MSLWVMIIIVLRKHVKQATSNPSICQGKTGWDAWLQKKIWFTLDCFIVDFSLLYMFKIQSFCREGGLHSLY